MKETWQIILSGVGGQGLMLAGKLLGIAATTYEGKNAIMSSAYGIETRGTFSKSDIIISKGEIDYPEVLQADLVIALAAVAYKKYAASLMEETILLYDDTIEPMPSKARQMGFPIAKIAKEALNPCGANIVSLGLLIGMTRVVKAEAVRKAIAAEFAGKQSLAELNLQSFSSGLAAIDIYS